MKVLLISNKIFHYRIPVYNYFTEKFSAKGMKLVVLANHIQLIDENPNFEFYIFHYNLITYIKQINRINPDIIIVFLHLSDIIIFPLYIYLIFRRIPTIYWGHGIDVLDPKNIVKNIFFRFFHWISNAIILYSPDQLEVIKKRNHKKTFIAYNTLNFRSFPSITLTKDEIKKKFNISYDRVILFVSQIRKNKRLDLLVNIFQSIKDNGIGLVIVGEGMPEELNEIIRKQNNIIYLGGIYDKTKINQLHKMADLFCIPGLNGLSINMAMYWGLPCLTLNVIHSPEIYYLKNGINGFIVESTKELKDKIILLCKDGDLLSQFTENAKTIIRREADIDRMVDGFFSAIEYIKQK
jgi:glycosyltransferase involved in cell wall biosynthesis